MSFSEKYTKVARAILPMPLTLAFLLTLVAMILALVLTKPEDHSYPIYFIEVLRFWESGFWDLLLFSVQMMLMLLLGYVIALTKPVNKLILKLVSFCTTNSRAAAIIAFFTMILSLLNWGLGLIFGAILARKVAENACSKGFNINYPLVGAAGYSGKLIWHGGLSGSAPIKVNEEGHFLQDQIGVISLAETTFSTTNLLILAIMIVLITLIMYLFGKSKKKSNLKSYFDGEENRSEKRSKEEIKGAEKLDHAPFLPYLFGILMLITVAYIGYEQMKTSIFSLLTPNFINFTFFGIALLLFGNLKRFMSSVEIAIKSCSGIMIQFPLYAGIAGIVKYSGLIDIFSSGMASIATPLTFPTLTIISAAVVNMFVPSGGGQWAVQGPIIVQSAAELGVSIPKSVMALAYGDQLTNMIQPFWALPLLGVTGLKAYEIIPYTLPLMIVGFLVYSLGIMFF